jgi:glycosidase
LILGEYFLANKDTSNPKGPTEHKLVFYINLCKRFLTNVKKLKGQNPMKFMKLSLAIILLLFSLSACASNQSTQESPKKNNQKSSEENDMWKTKNTSNSLAKSEVPIPEWSQDAVIYEVNVRQYTKEGTLKAFEAHLPRLKELGVKVLWFMPIYPISEKNRNGSLGSPYSVANYEEVNPDFGTMDDLKNLVKEAHSMGFKVMLDWVANHTGWDNPWIAKHPDWYTHDSDGNIIHPADTNWTDVADLNYDNQEMRTAMIDAMKFWVKESDIDGFRADYAQGVPADFWNEARAELDKIKPVYMLAEDEDHPDYLKQAFNANYSWRFYNLLNGVAQGKNDSSDIQNYLEALNKLYPEGTYPMFFTSNHDENFANGTEYDRLGDSVKTMAALTFTAPGIPLIYSGQEAGLKKSLPLFDKGEISWNDLSMQTFYEQLISLKENNQALWNGSAGGTINFLQTSNPNILAFYREKGQDKVIVVMNLSADSVKGQVSFDRLADSYQTLFSNKETKLDAQQAFDLKPWDYKVFYKK